MHSVTRKRKSGFSLVELVIVIVILAVISAIALPRVSRGAKGADQSALGQDLGVLRNAIEIYAAEHGGDFPGAKAAGGTFGALGTELAFKNQLTQYTDKAGAVSATKTGTFIYGPYLHKIPPAPVGANGGSTVTSVANTGPAVTAGTEGWVYNYVTGGIIVNSSATDESGSKTYDTW